MRVFVNRCDSFLGAALGAAFAAEGHEVVGTIDDHSEPPPWLSEAVYSDISMEDDEVLDMMRDCQTVILQLEGCEAAARNAAMFLANQKTSGSRKVFIGISQPLTWATTTLPDQFLEGVGQPMRPISSQSLRGTTPLDATIGSVVGSPPPAVGEERVGTATTRTSGLSDNSAAPPADGETSVKDSKAPATSSEKGVEAFGSEVAERFGPMPITGYDYERRMGGPGSAALTAAENCILRAARPNKLATYIVCPGILYGRGETDHMGLHHLFKAAYECQPVATYGPGTNYLPTVHVDDLCTYCMAVATSRPNNQYLLVADEGQITLGEVLQALSSHHGTGQLDPVPYEDLLFRTDLQYLLLNLPFQMSEIGDATPTLKCPQGLRGHLGKVFKEYLDTRNLHPLRVLLRGGPAVGKSFVASRLATWYGLKLVDVKAILEHRSSLPEDDELRKEVEAQLNSKEPRVSSKNMALLARRLLLDLHTRHKGYILDGFPRSLAAAKWLLTKEQEMTEEELTAWREEQEVAAAAAAGAEGEARGGKGGKDKGGGGKDKAKGGGKGVPPAEEEPPTNHPRIADTDLLPTFALTLSVPEELATERTEAVFAAEQEAVQKLIEAGEVDPKKPPPPSHHSEKDFQRRRAAWGALREVDTTDVEQETAKLKVAYRAELAEWEAKKAEIDAAAKEASEAAAVGAEASQAESEEPTPSATAAEVDYSELPPKPEKPTYPTYGGLDKFLDGLKVKVINFDAWPAEPEPEPEPEPQLKHEGPEDIKGEGALDSDTPAALKKGITFAGDNPEAGGEGAADARPVITPEIPGEVDTADDKTPEELEAEAEAARLEDIWQRKIRLDHNLKALLGRPHNYEGFRELPMAVVEEEKSAEKPLEAEPSALTRKQSSVVGFFAEDEDDEEEAEDLLESSPPAQDRLEDLPSSKAAKEADMARISEPIRRYLVERVTPAIAKALVEVCRVKPENPLEYVGNLLLAAGQEQGDAYHDPYESEVYAIQAEKILAKEGRETIRATERAAKAERDVVLFKELETLRRSVRSLPVDVAEEEAEATPKGKPTKAKTPPKDKKKAKGKK